MTGPVEGEREWEYHQDLRDRAHDDGASCILAVCAMLAAAAAVLISVTLLRAAYSVLVFLCGLLVYATCDLPV